MLTKSRLRIKKQIIAKCNRTIKKGPAKKNSLDEFQGSLLSFLKKQTLKAMSFISRLIIQERSFLKNKFEGVVIWFIHFYSLTWRTMRLMRLGCPWNNYYSFVCVAFNTQQIFTTRAWCQWFDYFSSVHVFNFSRQESSKSKHYFCHWKSEKLNKSNHNHLRRPSQLP